MSGGDGGNRTHLPNIGVRATMLDLEQASPVVGHLEATAVSGPVSSSPAVGEVPGQPVAPYTLSALVRKGSRPADKRPCAPSGSIQPLPRHRGLGAPMPKPPRDQPSFGSVGFVLWRPLVSMSPSFRRALTPQTGDLDPITERPRRPTGTGLLRHSDAIGSGVRVACGDRRRATTSHRFRTASSAPTRGTPCNCEDPATT